MALARRRLILRRIKDIYDFPGDEDNEVVNRGLMDISKLLIDRLDAKYIESLDLGFGSDGCVDIVLVCCSIYITINDEAINLTQVNTLIPSCCLILHHQETVEATVNLINQTILNLESGVAASQQ